MKVEVVVSLLVGLLSLFSLYLTVCGEVYYLVLSIVYGMCAYFLYNRNTVSRYVSFILVFGNFIINIATINLLYGTGRDSNAALQVFLDDFNEVRFFIEVGFSTMISLAAIILLILPKTGQRFKSKNA